MPVETKKINNTLIIYIKKKLDVNTSPTVEEKIIDVIKSASQDNFIVNLKEVEYINSTGLKIFVTVLHMLRGTHKKIVICNINNEIKNLFDVSGLMDIYKIFENENAAISSFENE
ncbi:STAS domain-containing protein [Spirochaetota bacterium]